MCDRYGNVLPDGIAGELCVAGIQMGAGYYRQPLLTAGKFTDLEVAGLGKTTVFKTGDLARYNKDGDLEFLGRIDDQIKIRGFRVELGEIENTAAAYENITSVAVMVRRDVLVLYYTCEGEVDEQKLRGFLLKTLPDHMIPEIYVRLDAIPLRENGKINRDALPEPGSLGASEITAPGTELEEKILDIVKQQLGIEEIGVTTGLLRMGLTSLGAMRLSSLLLRRLGISLKTADILKNPTVREMATYLDKDGDAKKEAVLEVAPCEKRMYYPITENQRGIYIEW